LSLIKDAVGTGKFLGSVAGIIGATDENTNSFQSSTPPFHYPDECMNLNDENDEALEGP